MILVLHVKKYIQYLQVIISQNMLGLGKGQTGQCDTVKIDN